MTEAHTPGPWQVTPRRNKMIDIQHSAGQEKGAITLNLCRVQARDSWVDEAEANARLIAAAPELLAALKDLADDMSERFDLDSPSTNPGIKNTIAAARQAIEKATSVT